MSRFAKTFNRARGSAGFTLLEVLVAFLILAVSLSVLWRSFSGDLASLDSSAFYASALAEARSQVDRLGTEVPLEEGEVRGRAEGGLSWVLRMHQDDTWSGQLGDEPAGAQVIPYEIEVVVTDRSDRVLTLTTLRLESVE
jgi:general secretion pathway protein I